MLATRRLYLTFDSSVLNLRADSGNKPKPRPKLIQTHQVGPHNVTNPIQSGSNTKEEEKSDFLCSKPNYLDALLSNQLSRKSTICIRRGPPPAFPISFTKHTYLPFHTYHVLQSSISCTYVSVSLAQGPSSLTFTFPDFCFSPFHIFIQ